MIDLGRQGKIVCLRAPLEKYEWKGNWNKNDPKWTSEILKIVKENKKLIENDMNDNLEFEEDENDFWVSYEDIIENFSILNVCKVRQMDEIRFRGKFLRV